MPPFSATWSPSDKARYLTQMGPPPTPVDATVVMLVAPTAVIAFFTCFFGIPSGRLSTFMLVAPGTPHVCHGCRRCLFLTAIFLLGSTDGPPFQRI
ncbi:hypothetical protein OPV22_003343 [Ensete ventricosum]|uniref:Uncharacterized protein n=1 Tax=Ensete ventricosum TaxID=4639 RepID=A0AAV8S0M3_ENSVE|nr:hypothetical protein OPV22_003343 [Ensete ventricosum]